MTLRILLVGLLLSTASCSLLVDNHADQCATDGDCARFPRTFCDLSVRLCKPLDSAISDAATKDAAGGASIDACGANTTFENACTNAACKPFDNRARLAHLPLDGGLTPLVARDFGSSDGGPKDAAADALQVEGAKGDASTDAAANIGAKGGE